MKVISNNRLTDSTLTGLEKAKKAKIEIEIGCHGSEVSIFDGFGECAGVCMTSSEMRAFAEELIFMSGAQGLLEEAKNGD